MNGSTTTLVEATVHEVVARVRRLPAVTAGASPGPGGAASVDHDVDRALDEVAPLLPAASRAAARRGALARLNGLGTLESWLADPDVTEVGVNAGTEVWIERAGAVRPAGRLPPGEADALVERAIAPLGLRFDRANPVVDARLPGGARLCAVREPVALDGTCVAIRRFALVDVTLDAFAPPAVVGLLAELVRGRSNVVVSGATSAGKTTLLNALAAHCHPGERLVTIEDAAELRLRTAHVVRLEARRASPDGLAEVTLRDLVRTALRLRPDRIVVGEVRGAEAFDMVQALNTGHDGSLSTVHANGPADALRRLVALALGGAPGLGREAVAEQVHSSIDVIVHVGRAAHGHRRVLEVAEVGSTHHGALTVRQLADAQEVVASPARRRSAPSEVAP